MKSEVSLPNGRAKHQTPVWDEVSGVRIRPKTPVYHDDEQGIISSVDLQAYAKEEQKRAEQKQKKISELEDKQHHLQQQLYNAGLDEYKLQLALVYADQSPNPYLQKELSRFRGFFGRPKIEEVEALAKQLLAVEKKLEALQMPVARRPMKEEQVEAPIFMPAPVGRGVVDRKPLTVGGSMGTGSPSFGGSTLAIGQRGFAVRSEQPFETDKFRLKWQKVIQQMNPEEKAIASKRFAYVKGLLENKRFHPINRAALERLFGTEDIATAYALHAYTIDRTAATKVEDIGGDISARVYKRANRLLENGIPPRDEAMVERVRKAHEAVRPPKGKTKAERLRDLNNFADELVNEEQAQKAERETKQMPFSGTLITPTAEMIYPEEESLSLGSEVVEGLDEEIPTSSLTELSEQFDRAFEPPEPDHEEVRRLRRRVQEIDPVETKISTEGFLPATRPIKEVRGLSKSDIESVADRLMAVVAPEQKNPVDWLRTELGSVQSREAKIGVLELLIKKFDLGKSFKEDIVLIKRGGYRETTDRYERAIERFIPIFEKALKNGKLVAKGDVEGFVEKIQSFAVIK